MLNTKLAFVLHSFPHLEDLHFIATSAITTERYVLNSGMLPLLAHIEALGTSSYDYSLVLRSKAVFRP